MLKRLDFNTDDRLLTGWEHGEDAALWALDEQRLGIFSIDVITPVVDDPLRWGEIAAANALSDIFAMGGQPLLALNFVGFPINCLPLEMLQEVLQGGLNKIREAGAVLAGGHSIEDEEPKFGLAVFGEVSREHAWRVGGARDGDVAILTKPLGTGIMATALKAEMVNAEETAEIVRVMTMLNDVPRFLPEQLRSAVRACTDITGFGLAGHALDMLSEGGLNLVMDVEGLPLLPGVLEKCDMGLIPAGGYNNRNQYETSVIGLEGLAPEKGDLLFDPQTSGGLLMAVDPAQAGEVLRTCREKGFDAAAVVGYFRRGEGKLLVG